MAKSKYTTQLYIMSELSDLASDSYLRMEYKRMGQAIKTIFGIIDSENVIKLFHSKKSFVALSLMITIFHNLFLRIGVYNWDKDTYMKLMDNIYESYHKKRDTSETDNIYIQDILKHKKLKDELGDSVLFCKPGKKDV